MKNQNQTTFSLDENRLRARFVSACSVAAVFNILMCFVYLALDFNAALLALMLMTSFVLFLLPRSEPDIAICFLVIHPGIFYVFTTFLFAASRGNFDLTGMVNLDISALVILLYQAAILIAYFCFKLFFPNRGLNTRTEIVSRKRGYLAAVIFLTVFVLTQLLNIEFIRSLNLAFASVFCVLSVLLAVETATLRAKIFVAVFSIVPIAVVSIALNQRAFLFLIMLVWMVVWLSQVKHVFRLKNIFLVVSSLFILQLMTNSFISARSFHRGMDPSASEIMATTLKFAMSPELLSQVASFSDEDRVLSFSDRSNRNYSQFLADNGTTQNLSTLSRLTLLPRMDIVVGRLGADVQGDLRTMVVLFQSAFPDFGQEKNLIYSDELIWGVGLKASGHISRPLVTIPGEAYSSGGLAGLFVVSLFGYLLLFVYCGTMRNIVGYGIPYCIGILVLTYSVTFTGTLVGFYFTLFRIFPVTLVALLFTRALSLRLKKRESLSERS